MIVGGLHKSSTDAPMTSMFTRCGGDTLSSKKSIKRELVQMQYNSLVWR